VTPAHTTALIAIVTRYQRADLAFMADNSLTNETALIESLEALLDWTPAPSDARYGMEYTRAYLAELVATGEPVNWRECLTQLLRRLDSVAPPTVGCEDADGLLHIHQESETCAVCAPTVHTPTTTGTCGTCAHFEKLGPSSRGLCRNSQSIAVDSHVTPDDGCRLGYTPKATS